MYWLEAIASRLEAIPIRLEAIAISLYFFAFILKASDLLDHTSSAFPRAILLVLSCGFIPLQVFQFDFSVFDFLKHEACSCLDSGRFLLANLCRDWLACIDLILWRLAVLLIFEFPLHNHCQRAFSQQRAGT